MTNGQGLQGGNISENELPAKFVVYTVGPVFPWEPWHNMWTMKFMYGGVKHKNYNKFRNCTPAPTLSFFKREKVF